jgi:O-antigen ligase
MTTHNAPLGPRRRQERLTFGHGSFAAVPTRAVAVSAAAELANEARPVRLLRLDTWDWGWGGLLMFTLLLFLRPQDVVPVIGILHAAEAAALVGLIAMVFLNLSNGRAITRMTPELAAVLALGGLMLALVPLSIWPGGSVQVFTTLFLKVMLIYMLMVNTMTSPKRIENLCWIVVLAFGYVALRAWFDYARGVNLVEGNRVQGAGGMFNNPNDLALNMATFLPLALMYVKRPGPPAKRIIGAGIALLMLGAIIFTKSRTGFVGTLVMGGVFLIASRSLKPATIVGGALAALLVLPLMPQTFWARMESITDASKDSTGSRSERIDLMEQAWLVFLEHPFTGVGAGQFQNYGPPGFGKPWRVTHNAYLQLGAEIGIFAVLIFLFLLARGFRAALWTRRSLAWTHAIRRTKRGPPVEREDGLTEHERTFLETHASAMVTCMATWFVCAMFASVAYEWTIYYVLGFSVTARDVARARARAYAQAKKLGAQEVVAA